MERVLQHKAGPYHSIQVQKYMRFSGTTMRPLRQVQTPSGETALEMHIFTCRRKAALFVELRNRVQSSLAASGETTVSRFDVASFLKAAA